MMSEDNKVSTYQFVAEPFHVDFTEKLTMGVLGNHLLNCAGFHAAERVQDKKQTQSFQQVYCSPQKRLIDPNVPKAA